MKKIKYGVLGLGWFGEKHLAALAGLPNVELHSLCTRNPARLAEVSSKFGAKKTFTDYHAMLADPELEAVTTMIEAWSGELTGCGVPLEIHQAGFLQRPVLLVIDGEEGGIVLAAGAKVPVSGDFPWKAAAPEVRVALQQGEEGGSMEPSALGTFVIGNVRPGAGTIDCHLVAQPDGALHFRATQQGRKLRVGWAPIGVER